MARTGLVAIARRAAASGELARPRRVTTSHALAPLRAAYAVATADLEPPVVVACSGGPDSVALLAITADAGLGPIAVHVDHGLRPGSQRERDHVAALAARFGVRFDARAVDVHRGSNLEERARDA